MPAAIGWRVFTLGRRFAGSAETLTDIQLTSRRDDGRCCAFLIRAAATDEECMAGRVLKRIAREKVNVSLTLPASLLSNREFAPRSSMCRGCILQECWGCILLMMVSHCHAPVTLFNTLSGRSRCKLTVAGQSEAHILHSPLQFFSALCPPYTLHQSLLGSHTGRLHDALQDVTV